MRRRVLLAVLLLAVAGTASAQYHRVTLNGVPYGGVDVALQKLHFGTTPAIWLRPSGDSTHVGS